MLRVAPGTYRFRIYPTVVNSSCIITKQEPTVKCSSGHIIPSSNNTSSHNWTDPSKIWVPSNPRGAERLPPSFVESESDFYLRRLWGKPSEDLKSKPKYLLTFTVGYMQKKNIDAAVKKFSDDFQILLFHYGKTTKWDEFEWSKNAIHVRARKQSKWYIKLVKKHGLEISQPGVETRRGSSPTWKLTESRTNSEVHKTSHEVKWKCKGPDQPPCAGFVEIMAPVFSREA